MKARNSFGPEYDCKYEWPCSVQCGDSGVVFSKTGGYRTAFFEAFPKEPACFLRGEGETIEDAEEACWQKYQKVLSCEHEMERRDRTDGYGYCKHCSYSSMVFEPLTKCCKCKTPTAYAQDHRKKWYCKKHRVTMPLDPNPSGFFSYRKKTRLPRKYKKKLKEAATLKFRSESYNDAVTYSKCITSTVTFKCKNAKISLLFRAQHKQLLNFKQSLS
jgi:hypothetical protein